MKGWKFVLVSVLVAALAGNVYFWYYHYANSFESGYDSGFLSGNEVGYQLGYGDGNQSGYQLGHAQGYSDGNRSGYLLGFYYGNETGFADGYVQGVEDGVGRGYTIRDPAYDEAIAFIAWDKTDENEYSENYTCFCFAADFKNNAFQAGYRCGFVRIEFPVYAHAIICFNTTDYGVIFVEPQWDDIVTLTIGQSYSDMNGYLPPDYDDTIVSFIIIW